MKELLEHHYRIVQFLLEVDFENQSVYFGSKYTDEQKELLMAILLAKEGPLLYQSDLARDLQVSTQTLSKITSALNESLGNFCQKFGISPPIQLYFRRPGQRIGGHFACKRTKGKDQPKGLISLNILNNTVSRISKTLKKERLEPQETEQQRVAALAIQPKRILNLRKQTIPIDPERKKQSLLSYKYRWPETVYGREKERERLCRFVNHPNENLLWWAMIGRGGTGKSRLALDLCFELDKEGWHAGFLTDSKDIEVLPSWKPEEPTLIVVDYTYEKAKILGECISKHLYENSKQWDFPVRILFLERYVRSPSFEQFCCSDQDIIKDNLAYHKLRNADEKGFLELGSLDETAIDSIVTEVFRREKSKEPSSRDLELIKEFLKERVHENNPLYAMILAEARTRNENVQGWDVEKLLDRHLKHTRKIWREATIDERNKDHQKHINLLALSTMVNGVNICGSDYMKCLDISNGQLTGKDILPLMDDVDEDTYKILCDNEATDILPPMEPDILGEHFVLRYWRGNVAERHKIRLLTKIAWQYDPSTFVDFVTRAATDFSADEAIDKIVELAEANGGLHLERTFLLYNLAFSCCMAQQLTKVLKYLTLIESIWKEHKNNKNISICLALTTYNLSCSYGKAGKQDEAVKYFDRTETVWKEHEDNDSISVLLAEASANIATRYGNTGKPDEAVKYFNRIDTLWRGRKKDKTISLRLAQAAATLASCYGNTGRLDEAIKYFNCINTVRKEHKKDKKIFLALAEAAANLTCYWGKAGKFDEAIKYFNCIDTVRKEHQKDKKIFLALAEAAANLIGCCGKAGKFDEAIKYFNLTETAWKEHRKDKDIALVLARVPGNMAISYAEAGKSDEAVKYFDLTETVWKEHKNDKNTSRRLAQAAIYMALNYGEAGQLDKAVKYFNRIETIWKEHKKDKEISLRLAQAACVCSEMFSAQGEITLSQQYKKIFKDLHKMYPEDEDFRRLSERFFNENGNTE